MEQSDHRPLRAGHLHHVVLPGQRDEEALEPKSDTILRRSPVHSINPTHEFLTHSLTVNKPE